MLLCPSFLQSLYTDYGSSRLILPLATAKKERKKSLTRGHVKDIGSTVVMQYYKGGRQSRCLVLVTKRALMRLVARRLLSSTEKKLEA